MKSQFTVQVHKTAEMIFSLFLNDLQLRTLLYMIYKTKTRTRAFN